MIYKNKNKKMEEKKMDNKKYKTRTQKEKLNWLWEQYKKKNLTNKQFVYLLKDFHGTTPNKWE